MEHHVYLKIEYAHPDDRLRIHVLNGHTDPDSFNLHSLSYGSDSDGAWPFHDHWRDICQYVNRGLFGGVVVKPKDHEHPPRLKLHDEIEDLIKPRLALHIDPAVVPENRDERKGGA